MTTPISRKVAPASTPSRSTAATATRSSPRPPTATRVRFDRLNPAPFSIDIGTSENLVVNMNGGNDFVLGDGQPGRPDQRDGRWRHRQRHHPRQQRDRHAPRRRRRRLHRRPAGQRHRVPGRRRRRVPVGSGRRQRRRSRARTAPTRFCSTAAPATRSSKPPPTASGCGSPATSATSSWTERRREPSISTRSAAPTRSPSATCPAPT